MPGQTMPMLPELLSTGHCSLQPNQVRAALVCRMTIDNEGNISDYQLQEASISSKAKLSYVDVASFLEGQAAEHEQAELLQQLKRVSQVLLNNRKDNNLIAGGRPEFRIRLNDQKKIDSIEHNTKTSAHLLVEECMIAANRCAADFMADQGIFHGHAGFRPERIEGVNKLVDEQLSIKDTDFRTVAAYKQLIDGIDDAAVAFPIRSVLSRMLARGKLSTSPKPHFGMGMERYTTFTSPIRKYSDLLAHRLIKAKLNGQEFSVTEPLLAELQSNLDRGRFARYQMEQWLKCQYLESLKGQKLSGIVSQINSNGFTIRLDGNGIEGVIDTRALKEKYSFDPLRLRLSSKDIVIELDQTINITIEKIDCKQRQINFAFAQSPKSVGAKESELTQ
jgi:ribonuclease R